MVERKGGSLIERISIKETLDDALFLAQVVGFSVLDLGEAVWEIGSYVVKDLYYTKLLGRERIYDHSSFEVSYKRR